MKRLSLLAFLLMVGAGIVVDGRQSPPPGTHEDADAFFDDGLLHEVRLDLNTRDWQSLKNRFLENTFYPADFRWRDEVVRNVGIRSRGTRSRNQSKPGLSVEFDRYVTGGQFLGLKSVVLRNNTQDPSNLNERLTMSLFRRMGIPAPRVAHTRLHVNGEDVGLYTIVESVDQPFLKRTFGEDQGYLYDYDYPASAKPYYFEHRGSKPMLYVPLPFKPVTRERNPRPEIIEELVRKINNTSDALFRQAVGEYLDLPKFLLYVAVEVLIADNDGMLGDYGMNNFYFYRFDNTKRFTFIPWDKSEAFKNGFEYGIFHNISDVPSLRQNRLMTRILRYPDLAELYLDILLEGAQSIDDRAGSPDGRGWLEREIEREYDQIRDAALADTFKPFSNDDFEGAIGALGDFARRRGDVVRSEVARIRASQ